MVRWPDKIKPGSRSDALVALTDLLATCAELVDHPLPDNAAEDSFSFLPRLLGRQPERTKTARTWLVCDGWRGDYSIRHGPWKLILPAPDFPEIRPGPELFKLVDDPGELKNLSNQHPETVARIQAYFTEIRNVGRSRP